MLIFLTVIIIHQLLYQQVAQVAQITTEPQAHRRLSQRILNQVIIYLILSSGQSEKLVSKISNIITNLGDLGPSRIIIVQTIHAGTTDIPNLLFLILKLSPESAQQSKLLIKYLTRNNLYRGNYKYNSTIYFIYFYPLLIVVTLN